MEITTMDRHVLRDLEGASKALKAAIIRSQNGIAALISVAKVSSSTLAASAPNILNELRQLEVEMQKVLRNYKDLLHKAFVSIPTDAPEEREH
jgi:hypothetical protein